MTKEELDIIESCANAATEGPWEPGDGHNYAGWAVVVPPERLLCSVAMSQKERQNTIFIAASRQYVPMLVAEVRRLRALTDEWERSAELACENPPSGCDCPGCSLARERANT